MCKNQFHHQFYGTSWKAQQAPCTCPRKETRSSHPRSSALFMRHLGRCQYVPCAPTTAAILGIASRRLSLSRHDRRWRPTLCAETRWEVCKRSLFGQRRPSWCVQTNSPHLQGPHRQVRGCELDDARQGCAVKTAKTDEACKRRAPAGSVPPIQGKLPARRSCANTPQQHRRVVMPKSSESTADKRHSGPPSPHYLPRTCLPAHKCPPALRLTPPGNGPPTCPLGVR